MSDRQLNQLRNERDRFLAFAFCGNDMLLELDRSGRIAFIAGTTGRYTGRDLNELKGAPLLDLIAESDREKMSDLLAAATKGSRFEDERISFIGREDVPKDGLITGFTLEAMRGRTFIAVRRAQFVTDITKLPPMPAAAAAGGQDGGPQPGFDADTQKLLDQMKDVIQTGTFDIAFQPVFTLRDRRRHHMEALLRFREDTIEIPPIQMIRLCEQAGLIADLDLAVLNKVTGRLLEVGDRGMPLAAAVNISGHSFQSPRFVERVEAALGSSRALPGLLIFEITDSATIQNLKEVNGMIQSLRYRGFRVSLDDFGSSGAAFEQLNALEVDFVKIGGDYIKKSMSDPRTQAFVRAMTGLCKELHIATIASQIEDKSVIDFLLEVEIDYGQGYMFGQPSVDADLLVGKSMSEIRWRRSSGDDDDQDG